MIDKGIIVQKYTQQRNRSPNFEDPERDKGIIVEKQTQQRNRSPNSEDPERDKGITVQKYTQQRNKSPISEHPERQGYYCKDICIQKYNWKEVPTLWTSKKCIIQPPSGPFPPKKITFIFLLQSCCFSSYKCFQFKLFTFS